MSYIISTVNTGTFTAGYMKFGSGSRNLVILPGLSVQSVLPYAEAIEKHYGIFEDAYTVYLLERRNEIPDGYRVSDMADDTAAVLSSLGIENADIFGASQGGMIALTLAAAYPSLVDKIAVASSAAGFDADCADIITEWISLARNKDREGLYLSFGEKINPPEIFKAARDAYSAVSQTVTDGELTRFIALAEATYGFDITDRAAEIKCPVLCVFDSSDEVLGAEAGYRIIELFSDRPDFVSFEYSGYGHAVYDNAPDFAERLYSFFMN